MALCDWGQHCDGSARFGTQLKSRRSSCFARLKASAAKLIALNFSPHSVDFVAKNSKRRNLSSRLTFRVFPLASSPEEYG